MEAEGIGKAPPKPVAVPITPGEVRACVEFSSRVLRARRYESGNAWQRGSLPALKFYGGAVVDKTLSPMVLGKVAELAVCKLAGVPVDFELRSCGDGGKDLLLPCGSTQVKASIKRYSTKFVKDPPENVDWFVFATWNGATRVVEIDGYVARAVIARLPVFQSPKGRWLNREVALSSLRPIRSLLSIRPICEVI